MTDLLTGLFPAAPRQLTSPLSAVLAVAAVLVGAALSLGRTPGAGPFNTLWLEDGTVFLTDAVRKSPISAVTEPYSGYYHLLPRLLAEIASLFPAGAAPAVLAVEAALVTSVLAVIVYVASAGHLNSRLLRLLVSAPLVLVPAGYTELPNAINELRWPLMYAMFWVLLWVPASRSGQLVGLTLVTIAAFTDNVVAIFLPLALLRLWVLRDRYAKFACAVLGAGFALNLTTNILGVSEHERIHPRVDLVWAVEAYVLRPVPQALLGERWVGLRPAHTLTGLAPVAAGWLILAGCALVAWRRLSRPNWPLALAAFVYSGALYAAIVIIAGVTAPRYSGPAALLTLACAVALVRPKGVTRAVPAISPVGPRSVTRAVPAIVLTALMLAVVVVNYRVDNLRGHGPLWSDELREARTQCAQATPDTIVKLQVAPTVMNWYAELPCSYVRS
jgi:hypothetical protein